MCRRSSTLKCFWKSPKWVPVSDLEFVAYEKHRAPGDGASPSPQDLRAGSRTNSGCPVHSALSRPCAVAGKKCPRLAAGKSLASMSPMAGDGDPATRGCSRLSRIMIIMSEKSAYPSGAECSLSTRIARLHHRSRGAITILEGTAMKNAFVASLALARGLVLGAGVASAAGEEVEGIMVNRGSGSPGDGKNVVMKGSPLPLRGHAVKVGEPL